MDANEVEIVRLKEQIKSNERALALAAAETARRLDELNHAHARALDAQGRTVVREVFDLAMKELTGRVTALEGESRESRGRMWLPMIVIAALAAGAAAALVKLMVR